MHMLELQELLDVVLRVAGAELVQHVFVESELRHLAGTKKIRRGDDGWLSFRDGAVLVLNHLGL